MFPILEKMSVAVGSAFDLQHASVGLVLDEMAMDMTKGHCAVQSLTHVAIAELGFLPFSVVAMACPGPSPTDTVAIGDWGEVRHFTRNGIREETIDVRRGPLRALKVIGGRLYVCGADLQVFRHTQKGTWEDISPPEALRADFPGNHLEAIDGFSETDIYAAGRDGVIWTFDGAVWTPVQSATNLSFFAICCGEDGIVHACGQAGMIAKGRGTSFEVFTPPQQMTDLWSISAFRGVIYAASVRAIFVWDGKKFELSKQAVQAAGTFGMLHATKEILWSFGPKDILRTDGEKWVRTDRVRVE